VADPGIFFVVNPTQLCFSKLYVPQTLTEVRLFHM